MDLQFFADETGTMILAAGALGTAAFGFVDIWKVWITGRGRGHFFARADPEGWEVYQLVLGKREWVDMPLSKIISTKLKEDPEAFVEEYVQALTDELDLATLQDKDSERSTAIAELATKLGWTSALKDAEQLNPITGKEQPSEALLALAMTRRAAALRNLDRRARFAARAAQDMYSRANRSAAMVTAVVMSALAWWAYSANQIGDPSFCSPEKLAGLSDAAKGACEGSLNRPRIWNLWVMLQYRGLELPYFLFVGALAVPVAPVAKQLSTALSDLAGSASALGARLTGRGED